MESLLGSVATSAELPNDRFMKPVRAAQNLQAFQPSAPLNKPGAEAKGSPDRISTTVAFESCSSDPNMKNKPKAVPALRCSLDLTANDGLAASLRLHFALAPAGEIAKSADFPELGYVYSSSSSFWDRTCRIPLAAALSW